VPPAAQRYAVGQTPRILEKNNPNAAGNAATSAKVVSRRCDVTATVLRGVDASTARLG